MQCTTRKGKKVSVKSKKRIEDFRDYYILHTQMNPSVEQNIDSILKKYSLLEKQRLKPIFDGFFFRKQKIKMFLLAVIDRGSEYEFVSFYFDEEYGSFSDTKLIGDKLEFHLSYQERLDLVSWGCIIVPENSTYDISDMHEEVKNKLIRLGECDEDTVDRFEMLYRLTNHINQEKGMKNVI